MIGLAGVIGGAITELSETLFHGIQIGLVVGVLNTTVILSPLVEWWADNLPDRALGRLSRVPASYLFRRLRVCEPPGVGAILQSGFKMKILV